MNTPIYTTKAVTYGYSVRSRKWEFFVNINEERATFLYPCKGKEQAAKVASAVTGSIARTKAPRLDGMGYANIQKALAA